MGEVILLLAASAALWTVCAAWVAVRRLRLERKLSACRASLHQLNSEVGDLELEKQHFTRLARELESGTVRA